METIRLKLDGLIVLVDVAFRCWKMDGRCARNAGRQKDPRTTTTMGLSMGWGACPLPRGLPPLHRYNHHHHHQALHRRVLTLGLRHSRLLLIRLAGGFLEVVGGMSRRTLKAVESIPAYMEGGGGKRQVLVVIMTSTKKTRKVVVVVVVVVVMQMKLMAMLMG